VLHALREAKGAMTERAMATQYNITTQHDDFANAVAICVRQGKVVRAMGLTEDGQVGIMVSLTDTGNSTQDSTHEDS